MVDGEAASQERDCSLSDRAARLKTAIEGLPASLKHIEVYDTLSELEIVDIDGAKPLLERLNSALVDAPNLSELVNAELGDLLVNIDVQPNKGALGVLDRMILRHGAVDVEDLERQTDRLLDQVDQLRSELNRLKIRSDMAVRLSNIFAFVAIVLALLLLVSGLVSDYLSVDWSIYQSIPGTEEAP
mgnify:CR=1 FL=1